jgi:hypothetical protein
LKPFKRLFTSLAIAWARIPIAVSFGGLLA